MTAPQAAPGILLPAWENSSATTEPHATRPAPRVSTRAAGPKTHQDVAVHPGNGDQPMLPCRTHAWGLLDADVHDFGKVTEGLEKLRKKEQTRGWGIAFLSIQCLSEPAALIQPCHAYFSLLPTPNS